MIILSVQQTMPRKLKQRIPLRTAQAQFAQVQVGGVAKFWGGKMFDFR